MFGSYSVRVLVVAAAFVFAPAFVTAPEAVAAGSADVAVLVSVDNPSPNVGDTVTFTVTVVNGGPDTATNVAVRDQLPSGLQPIAATPSLGTYVFSSGVWTVGTVNVGGAGVQTLQLLARVVSPSSQVDTATGTADQTDPNRGNNSASAGETPRHADLALAQSVDHPTPRAGQIVTFTVTLRDNGPDPATNVTVQDLLPPGLSFISATPSLGTYSLGTGAWTVGTVSTSTPQTLSLQATYNGPGRVVNTASVSHADQFDPDAANNSSSLTVPATPTQIVVASSANPSLSSQPLRFTATVSPAPDGGSVTFTIDGTTLAPSVPVSTATGTATSPAISSLAAGSHQVVATYTGDANYLSSASPGLTQVVNGVPSASTGPPPPPPPPVAMLGGLNLSPRSFSLAGRKVAGRCVKPTKNNRRRPACTRKVMLTIRYTLTTAATITFTINGTLPGRRIAGRCVAQTRGNRHHKKCTRGSTLPGATAQAGLAGANTLPLARKLAPGSYTLTATPARGAPQRVTFRIVP